LFLLIEVVVKIHLLTEQIRVGVFHVGGTSEPIIASNSTHSPNMTHDMQNHPFAALANPIFCDRVRARKKPGNCFSTLKTQ
jgi:hypothetical protein